MQAAISWCHAATKCAGFTAQVPSCSSRQQLQGLASDQQQGQKLYYFKASWGVQHKGVAQGWSSWTVPPPPSPAALGAMVRLGFHHALNCPTAATSGNVSWLWASPRYLPCSNISETGCNKTANVTASGLDLDVTARAPSALALHFSNGDHDMTVQLPLSISLTWH